MRLCVVWRGMRFLCASRSSVPDNLWICWPALTNAGGRAEVSEAIMFWHRSWKAAAEEMLIEVPSRGGWQVLDTTRGAAAAALHCQDKPKDPRQGNAVHSTVGSCRGRGVWDTNPQGKWECQYLEKNAYLFYCTGYTLSMGKDLGRALTAEKLSVGLHITHEQPGSVTRSFTLVKSSWSSS